MNFDRYLEKNLQYLIIDTEVLEDYFSFQYKNENSETKVIEIESDKGFKQFYNLLEKSKRPMYFYGIDYDKVILNAVCKLVESNSNDINYKLRNINDFIIRGNINYFRLNREFWVNNYFKFKKTCPELKSKDLITRSIDSFKGNQTEYDFLNQHLTIMGQSKVFKNLIINSLPKINYYFSVRKDKSLIPTISLKNLQLVNEGYKIEFDFNKYRRISDIKKDGKYEYFNKYSKNDITSLEKEFLKKPKSDIIERLYAVEAVKELIPDLEVSKKAIYSENNTELINEILKLPDHEDKKELRDNFDFDYTEYIKTPDDKFNSFVEFVNNSKHIKNDREIKANYCEFYKREVIQDDKEILNTFGEIETQINSFDEIHIKNKINDIIVKMGFGGLHGAIPNYKSLDKLLKIFDYKSQYPSIVLQYPELFKHVINVDLYRAIYEKRFKIKAEIKQLIKDQKEYLIRINDGADIAEYEAIEDHITYLTKVEKGLKLILNTAFGLINSNYNIPIACKTLGRFICLKGQSLLLNLCYKVMNDYEIINVNTDGVMVNDTISNKVIEFPTDGYFELGVENFKTMIQNDVNNYLGIMTDSKVKRKGMYNIKIKQKINKNEKLAVNLQNAINSIIGKELIIEPCYFDKKWFDKEISSQAWYFTTKEKGQTIIKNTKKPEILSIVVNGISQNLYFTNDKSKADFKLYIHYAEIIKDQLLKFEYISKNKINNMYYEETLEFDSLELIKSKRQIKRKLNKLFDSMAVGMVGYKFKNKVNSFVYRQPIKPLIQYTMTDILKSTYCTGFSLDNNVKSEKKYIIIDIDIYDKNTGTAKKGWGIVKPFISELNKLNTFQCWNMKTLKYNRKYVFQYDLDFIEFWKKHLESKVYPYIELIDKATIFTLEGLGDIQYQCNWLDPLEVPKGLFKTLK